MSAPPDPGSRPTVALSVSSFGAADPAPRALLEEAGAELVENPHGRKLSAAEVSELIAGADGLIAGTEPLTADVLDRAPRLRVISRVGVGLENVDLEAAQRRGIAVRNTPDAVTDPVAELTLGGILALLRQLAPMDAALRAGRWERRMGGLLRGRTVGIVGFGRIGRRVAELLEPFGVRLLVCDPAPATDAAARACGAEPVALGTLLAEAEIVTLHLPGVAAPVIGAAEIAAMPTGAILVNAARGGLVDEDALLAALREERLAGAYLDTFAAEPYEGPLRELPSVLLTPHVGSYAREARVQMETEAARNLLEALVADVATGTATEVTR